MISCVKPLMPSVWDNSVLEVVNENCFVIKVKRKYIDRMFLIPFGSVCLTGCSGLEVCGSGVGPDLPLGLSHSLCAWDHPHLHPSGADVPQHSLEISAYEISFDIRMTSFKYV